MRLWNELSLAFTVIVAVLRCRERSKTKPAPIVIDYGHEAIQRSHRHSHEAIFEERENSLGREKGNSTYS
jgi:hypothetical protein